MSARRPVWVLALLVLCVAALVLTAFDTQRGGSLAKPGRVGASVAREPAPSTRVIYTGPRRLESIATLRASVRRAGARIVAVTFLLDGEPLGSDTRPPYRLDVDASLLRRGRHRLRVVAVDRLGGRSFGRAVSVSAGAGRRALTATPATGLGPVLPELARGDVSVRLAPGRYVVPHLELGGGARLVGSGPRTVVAARSRSTTTSATSTIPARPTAPTRAGSGRAASQRRSSATGFATRDGMASRRSAPRAA